MTTLALQPAAQGSTKLRLSAYWTTTTLTALAFLAGGVADLSRGPALASAMAHLGYPAYFMLILGTWKMLGAVAIVAPGFPRLKEWAYAGMAFDLSGAALSHAAVGDPTAKVLVPIVILGLVAASWALRPAASGRIVRATGLTR